MKSETRVLSPSIFTVSYNDMIDIWVETMHPNDNVIVIWDAVKHLDLIKASGFRTRVDGAIFQGYKVTPYYDSMVCKLICHGRNRTEAIQRMNRSLDEFVIEGITTTISLHKKLLNHKKFINSDFNVSWLDKDTIV